MSPKWYFLPELSKLKLVHFISYKNRILTWPLVTVSRSLPSCCPISGCVGTILLSVGSDDEGGVTGSTVTHRVLGYLALFPVLHQFQTSLMLFSSSLVSVKVGWGLNIWSLHLWPNLSLLQSASTTLRKAQAILYQPPLNYCMKHCIISWLFVYLSDHILCNSC